MSRKHRKNNLSENVNTVQTNSNKLSKEFKTKTNGQIDYVRAMVESHITICTGPAGTGKTACAVGFACSLLVRGEIERIVVTRPVVETSPRGLGYLPGDIDSKMRPYARPVLDELEYYLGKARTELFFKNGTIVIEPLEYMRGRNFHQSFVILDEAQNATKSQIKMMLTRIGSRSKVILAGDLHQSDMPDDIDGLEYCVGRLSGVNGVSIITLTKDDIVRHSIIADIVERL